ncbi:spondin domain-containing protein [Aliikangiella coralliicola]|uniref:Uncharacterized protein n=1 Tax=Aliikangiella coralliicola TaxID=2592383 RepID=A0A545UAF6_9GAMM|nr:spondin domain-containing protein [Aliikangiella coralliicola]TQV86455.1 hypothetical protein FLL46_16195 [Aliikangiella coralliicola]
MTKLIMRCLLVAAVGIISACSSDNNNNQNTGTGGVVTPPPIQTKLFNVEFTNLTNAQPLSPVALVLHTEGQLWQLNQASSDALELLAEAGDNSAILAEDFVQDSVSGEGVVMPGVTRALAIEAPTSGDAYLSLATMLVNTNDAFTGFTRMDVSNMATNESVTLSIAAYDSGTEANSEAAGSIPGPADGGEGYNSVRDDVDFVARHPGVVTADDGLTTSVLNESHRFDNPVIRVTVLRIR